MIDTVPAPAAAPEPEGQPCPDCGQVHPAVDLSQVSAQQLHDIATAALAQAASEVVTAEPGKYPAVEKALEAINLTAREVLRERLLEMILGKGRDIVAESARKTQTRAAAVPEAQQAIPFPEPVGPYL